MAVSFAPRAYVTYVKEDFEKSGQFLNVMFSSFEAESGMLVAVNGMIGISLNTISYVNVIQVGSEHS